MKIKVYSDPGHAWAKISIKKLEELNIADKISSFSYMRKGYCYLEEDSDLSCLVSRLKELNISYSFEVNNSNRQSRIRNYSSYRRNDE